MATYQLIRYLELSLLFKTLQTLYVWTLFSVEKNAWNVFHHPLVILFLKLRQLCKIGPVENCSISSSVQLLFQKLFWASDQPISSAQPDSTYPILVNNCISRVIKQSKVKLGEGHSLYADQIFKQ